MFDTYVTIVGNVMTAPEWRNTQKVKAPVANFKVVSTARRFDRENNRWVDGNSLRVRVSCWRALADGVAGSIMVGDPVVVVGRLYTRDWMTEENEHRVAYELEAVAVGHDLSRGKAVFKRRKPSSTVTVEDSEADQRVGGELTEALDELNATTLQAVGRDDSGYGEEYYDSDDFESFPLVPPAEDAVAILREAGLETQQLDGYAASHDRGGSDEESGSDDASGSDDGSGSDSAAGSDGGSGSDEEQAARGGRGRGRRGRQAVPA
jgi:single-strand DNA-binding protein